MEGSQRCRWCSRATWHTGCLSNAKTFYHFKSNDWEHHAISFLFSHSLWLYKFHCHSRVYIHFCSFATVHFHRHSNSTPSMTFYDSDMFGHWRKSLLVHAFHTIVSILLLFNAKFYIRNHQNGYLWLMVSFFHRFFCECVHGVCTMRISVHVIICCSSDECVRRDKSGKLYSFYGV